MQYEEEPRERILILNDGGVESAALHQMYKDHEIHSLFFVTDDNGHRYKFAFNIAKKIGARYYVETIKYTGDYKEDVPGKSNIMVHRAMPLANRLGVNKILIGKSAITREEKDYLINLISLTGFHDFTLDAPLSIYTKLESAQLIKENGWDKDDYWACMRSFECKRCEGCLTKRGVFEK